MQGRRGGGGQGRCPMYTRMYRWVLQALKHRASGAVNVVACRRPPAVVQAFGVPINVGFCSIDYGNLSSNCTATDLTFGERVRAVQKRMGTAHASRDWYAGT